MDRVMKRWRNLFYAMRPQQWIKNGFLFLPVIFGKSLLAASVFFNTAWGFVLFCMASSTVYLMNDILDIKKDRAHPAKRLRPLASGKIKIGEARTLLLVTVIIALLGAAMLDQRFFAIVLCYLVFNAAYSLLFKNWVILDVFCIAGFFLMRIYAGSVLSGVSLSPWIVMMTALLALFLGFSKRRQELKWLKVKAGKHRSVLARYDIYFIDQMISIITASVVIAYSLYTVDPRTVAIFKTHHLLYTVPFVYYGIFRYLYLIHVHNNEGDPTRVVLTDSPTRINLFLWLTMCVLIIYFGL